MRGGADIDDDLHWGRMRWGIEVAGVGRRHGEAGGDSRTEAGSIIASGRSL